MSIFNEKKDFLNIPFLFKLNNTSFKSMKIGYFQSKMKLTVGQRRIQVSSAAEIAVTPYCKLMRKS